MRDSAVWVPALRSLLDGAARRKSLACPGRRLSVWCAPVSTSVIASVSEAIQTLTAAAAWVASSLTLLAMTAEAWVRILATISVRVMHRACPLEKQRAQGMPGARCTRGLVCTERKQETHTSIQVQRRQSGIPCAVVLRLTSCSPRGPGFLAPVVRANAEASSRA